MRETKNDREQRKQAGRLALCLCAGVICVTMLYSEVLGNKIDDVTVEPHYKATWSPVSCGGSVCECKWWAYVTWDVDPGSDQDSFTIQIWEPGEGTGSSSDDYRPPSGTKIGETTTEGPYPWNGKVEITNSVGLTPGEHTIRAWVAGDEISSPGKWGHSEACTVYIAEVNDIDVDANEVCVDCNVTFTADPNPPGKELRCLEWQKGYKADSSSSWTWDEPETGGAYRILNTSTAGIYCYRARNCKDYGCNDCNWVESEAVNVVDVDKVVKEGTTDEGALYVCVGEDVNLQALPDPCGASFPEDQPTWQVLVKPQGSNPTLTPADGNTTTLGGLSLPGNYYVKAKCCNGIGDVIVVIVFEIEQDYELWWFNGENPIYYDTEVTLTASGLSTGSFEWTVTAGTGKVDLNNGGADSDTITATDDNTVVMKSTAASTSTGGVTVQLEHNGTVACTIDTEVYAPDSLDHIDNNDINCLDGYMTYVTYTTLDQFGDPLPSDVEMTEYFSTTGQPHDDMTSPVPDWPLPCDCSCPAGGAILPPTWQDGINALDGVSYTPDPQNPGSPLGSTKVDHWHGSWYVGSTTCGGCGVLVKTLKWQRYLDHARHEPE
jgi:hypothetical protein